MVMRFRKEYFTLICLGIFLTPSIMRVGVLKSHWGLINPLAWIGIVAIVYMNLLKRYKTIDILEGLKYIWLPILACLFIVSTITFQSFEKIAIAKYLYATLLPGVILYIGVSDNDLITYLNIFCSFLTVACTFIVICGLLDLILSLGIGSFFAEITGVQSSVALIRDGRMVSYYGHALLSSELMILCFSFNSIRGLYFKQWDSLLYTIFYSAIALIGVGLSGSKVGLILIIIEFFILYFSKKNIKYSAIMALCIYGVYKIGFLDTVLYRFLRGIQKGDLSSGRHTNLSLLWRSGMLDFKIFKGNIGTEFTPAMIKALEYPLLRWAYLFGIWFSIVICIVFFVIPLINCAKSGKFKLFVIATIIIMDVNSYSGITTLSDHMLIYCVSMFLLLNVARILKGDTNEALLYNTKSIHLRRNTASYYDTAR